MKIVLAGGTGFLGSSLSETWAEDGHDVRVLTRAIAPGDSRHDPGTGVPGITRAGWTADGGTGAWAETLSGADAVINLAGASVWEKRWTPPRKAELRDSRLRATRSLVRAINDADVPPALFLSTSGVDYYGAGGAEPLTESSAPGEDFLAQLCQDWEAEARQLQREGVRLVILRTGMVLARSGGALPQMMAPFRFFAGGPLGSGGQFISWIHRLDWIEMVRWIVQTPEVAGVINATAPHPVTSRQFARALGRAMHRPALVPAPAFALKLVLGEFARYVLTGRRVIPERALALGYHFRYPELDIALRGILGE